MSGAEARRCFDCKQGEHDNYDDNVRLYRVKDPETGRTWRKWMCGEHVAAHLDDGYELDEVRS